MTRTVALALLLWSCDGAPAEPDPAGAPDPGPTEARFGGVLVTLGAHTAELVVHETGELHLHAPEALADAGATVTLDGADDETHAVSMRWEDAVQGFVGALDGAPAPGDAEVLLVHEGHVARAAVAIDALLPAPEHEGSVVAVGGHTVEVVVESDGRAHAYVLDDPRHRLDVELTLNLAGEDAHMHPLALSWDEDAGHYVGHLEGLHPAAGPLEVIARERETEALGHGSLLDVALARPEALGADVPSDFRLDLPELGSTAPAVIPIPPAGDDAEAP